MSKNVFINGDKTGFNSKMAVDKFKVSAKKDCNLAVLQEKYIKPDFTLSLAGQTDTTITFNIMKKVETIPEPVPVDDKKQLLRMKLNMMKNSRTNKEVHKAKNNKDVPEEILSEYLKLKKGANIPIPAPDEILSNPEQYKPIISMLLSNEATKKHKYFKLLGEKLGLTADDNTPVEKSDKIVDINSVEGKGNHINMGDYETDSETDSDQ
jgi:hypothetical protein